MADILLDEQSAPVAPSAGQGILWTDNSVSLPGYKDDAGRGFMLGGGFNGPPAVANQTLAASDTYVTGSKIFIPSFGLQVGSVYTVSLILSKTAAGVAAPVWTVRLGTAGSTADASQWTHTGVAQTAVVESGRYTLTFTVRSIGASGVLQGNISVVRTGGTAATGLSSVPSADVTGAAADKSWVSNQVIGLSINAGASSVWTVTQCVARLLP